MLKTQNIKINEKLIKKDTRKHSNYVEEKFTFKPSLNKKSIQMAKKDQSVGLHERT